jgi:hypothetical protein
LEAGTGQLDCSDIDIIPGKPEEEIDHPLVERFFGALEKGDINSVRNLLTNEPRLIGARNGQYDNGTPLIVCAWKEMPEIAQLLIDHSADTEAMDSNWKSSALAWCGWWGSPKTAEVLLKVGANPRFMSVYGVTPLSSAKDGKEYNKSSRGTSQDYEKVISLLRGSVKTSPMQP